MKIRFVIESLVVGGFYSEETNSFRGYIFATLYDTRKDAHERIGRLDKDGIYKITKIYIKVKYTSKE